MKQQQSVSEIIEFICNGHFDETYDYLIPLLRNLLQEPKELVVCSEPLDLYRILAAIASFETLATAYNIIPDENNEFQNDYNFIRDQLIVNLKGTDWAGYTDFVEAKLTWADRSEEIRRIIENTK